MNKAYLLMLCLLSTSFVGCLDSDEDETLEPLGTDENNESSYDGLEAEIKNLTKEIEKLHDDLKSLESYQYNPPENSTLYFENYDYDNGKFYNDYIVEKNGHNLILKFVGQSPSYIQTEQNSENNNNGTDNSNCNGVQNNSTNGNNTNDDCDNDGIKNEVDNCPNTANNNQNDRDEDGIGDVCDLYPDTNLENYEPCTLSYVNFIIYNSNMDIIRQGTPPVISDSYERNCILKEQYQTNSYTWNEQFGLMWSEAYFSLEEEPVRMQIGGTILTF